MPLISSDTLRKDARHIFDAALLAVDPEKAIHRYVKCTNHTLSVDQQTYDLETYKHIYVVGTGKAGGLMAVALESILADHLTGGVVNVKYDHTVPLKHIKLIEAAHPLPDDAGVQGTRKMAHLLDSLDEHDLVFCVLSGGGSALMPLPVSGVTLEEKQAVTGQLLACGATINEINTIRKHISQVKGGQLARLASPATIVSLILSDVIGDPLDVIASGPTVPDPSTFADCRLILKRYHLEDTLPSSVVQHLIEGEKGQAAETPKPEDAVFNRVQNVLIATGSQALEAARIEAERRGYHPMILSSSIDGETREIARVYAAIAREIHTSSQPVSPPACIISGGETTVTLFGKGKGGRNQEFVLAAAPGIKDLDQTVVFSAGTDGTDGPTDAAGAIADGFTMERAEQGGLNAEAYLNDNDAYHFFQALDDLIITGPTNTNVMDLRLLLVGPRAV